MTLYQNKYRIESNRWQFWNYSSPGSYFLTVCVQGRNRILGRIENSKMKLSGAGIIVSDHFNEIPTYHKRIVLDEWVIMPNHFHCMITLGDIDFDNGVSVIGDDGDDITVDQIHVDQIHEFDLQQQRWINQTTKTSTKNHIKQYRALRRKMLIPKIMGKLKMQTSKQINILNNTVGNKNWQSDYHDHVIRSSSEHQNIKQYIKNNPLHWQDDTFNK